MKWISFVLLFVVAGIATYWVFSPAKSTTKPLIAIEAEPRDGKSDKNATEAPVQTEVMTRESESKPIEDPTSKEGHSPPVPIAKSEPAVAENSSHPSGPRSSPRERPLAVEIGKEAYNALTELKALVESQSWEDAARLVASLDAHSVRGVAPYVSDQDLLTSLTVATDLVFQDYPQIREALGEKFAAVGKLRVAQAIAAGDVPRLELASVQFAGTPGAVEAHRWLGDRALAAGFFARAISHYERAAKAQLESEIDFEPRIRLAAAMLGRDQGRPPGTTVNFGDLAISPAEFEALITEMRERATPIHSASKPALWPIPKPNQFETRLIGRLEAGTGERSQEGGKRTSQARAPWIDRQIAATVDEDTMYMANQFQIAAFRLTTGERIWQTEKPSGHVQRAPEWAGVQMRPLVFGNRIVVRLVHSSIPSLTCHEKTSGKLLWVGESREREPLVSDPLLVEGQLVAFSLSSRSEQNRVLRYCTFDVRTGELVDQEEVVRLPSGWNSRPGCEVAEVESGVIATFGGATIGVDAEGHTRWIRLHGIAADDEDSRSGQQMYDRPVVDGDRIYVAQPGARTVDCLAAGTGRRYWSADLPEIVGMVGVAGDFVVVRTADGIRSLDADNGATRWHHPAAELCSFPLVDHEHALLACRERAPDSADQWQIGLRWLKVADGTPVGASVLPGLQDSDRQVGPLVAYQDRIFTFFGRGQYDATRDVVELAPRGSATGQDAPAKETRQ